MRKFATVTTFVALILAVSCAQVLAQDDENIETQRLGQTGLKFLSLSVGPRAAAMGDAVTATQQSSSIAMMYNPAGMAQMEGFADVSLGQVQWIADTKYNVGTAAIRPANGIYGTIGISVQAVDYPEFLGTVRADTPSGFEDTGTFSPSAMALGLGYARELSDRFSVGGNVKYARQSLGESIMSRSEESGAVTTQSNSVSTAAFDFGILYATGFESLNFAVSIRNFSRELTYAEESFELPLTFNIGVSMDVTDLAPSVGDTHAFLVSVDAERPRDYPEQIKVGGEYTFMDLLSLRGGYTYPSDERGVNLGAGVNLGMNDMHVSANYAYSQFGIFGSVHRVGLAFGL